MAAEWRVPTGFSDPGDNWSNQTTAYDEDTLTMANTEHIQPKTFSSFLELTITSMRCSKIKFYSQKPTGINKIYIEVYHNNQWNLVYNADYDHNEWTEVSLNGYYYVTKARVAFYNDADVAKYAFLNEFAFYYDPAAPTVTVQAPTLVLPTTVTANGNITVLDEEATVKGFKYGLTKVDTWDVHDDGNFSVGAYTKGLTGLTANTTYWIRAYATNEIGTGYSEWIQFQTAASGTIPTGTNLFICGDYSGYSFQLMKSETDDGETYTAYFVISTDLTNKQGLAFYKRILDLHLYFKSESSGTATIYVKRDNEAEWQTVGTVSLTGTEDVIIKHLAPDIRGKVFLFKISASNFFRFLGILFEYLGEDLR